MFRGFVVVGMMGGEKEETSKEDSVGTRTGTRDTLGKVSSSY